jgi:hypothetical protein
MDSIMKKIFTIFLAALFLFVIGCKNDENPVNSTNDIPADPTNVTVPQTTVNNVTPTSTFNKSSGNSSRIQMNMTGLVNPITNQPISFVAQQNLFVTEDGSVKGLKVTKVGTGNVLKADIVFTVDNSGSMGQEADSVAASIINFANFLQSSGLDVKFAVVGYDGNVNGAINFTNANAISAYLNKDGYSGTYRTIGFSGSDSAALETKAYSFASGVYGENGTVGVLFADSNFSWRAGAQRVFVNFTDESTQPDYNLVWTTQKMCNLMSGKATIHTVYSGPADTSSGLNGQWNNYNERPWLMSLCSGGTVKFIPQDASGLDLKNLPVAGALSNSYLVEFITSNPNGTHTVEIIIKEGNSADGKRTYKNITY